MKIEKYDYNKWVDKWVLYQGKTKFEWLVSRQAPLVKYANNKDSLKWIITSGLSSSAKVVFCFLQQTRFGYTPVSLFGNGQIAKQTGLAEKTVKKAIDELIDSNTIYKMKIYHWQNVGYQYYIKPDKDWILPPNRNFLDNTYSRISPANPKQVLEL